MNGARTWETWQERQARIDAARRSPQALADLARRVCEAVVFGGVDAVGITGTDPFPLVRAAIEARKQAGFDAGMSFTFKRPERSTDPRQLLVGAATLVVGARSYRRQPTADPVGGHGGRVAQYQWTDHYGVLRAALADGGALLRAEGWKARVVVDDNALVDRAAAHRAGLGWWGKNANLLLPGKGSWFVLGSLVTDAPLPVSSAEPVADGCGPCTRCLPACPTGAIVEPGVIDARRCLAWLVQAPGDIPHQYRVAMGNRIYGCDDCQDVCPVNRLAERVAQPPPAEPTALPWVALVDLVLAPREKILADHGRWYLPGRDTDALRRNALVALGNVGDPSSPEVRAAVAVCLADPNPMVRRHAAWAAGRLGMKAELERVMGAEADATVRQEIRDAPTGR